LVVPQNVIGLGLGFIKKRKNNKNDVGVFHKKIFLSEFMRMWGVQMQR
jgi:hypothetical protein